MKRYLGAILVIGLLFSSTAYSQLSDSLYIELPDSIKPKDKNHLAEDERRRILQGASYLFPVRQFYHELNKMAEDLSANVDTISRKSDKIHDLVIIADYYYVLPNGKMAYSYYKRIIKEIATDKSLSAVASYAYRQIGSYFSYDGRQDSAIQNLHKSLDIAKSVNDSTGIRDALAGYAQIYYGLELYERAIEYNNQFLHYIDKNEEWGNLYTSNYLKASLFYSKLYDATNEERFSDSAKEVIRKLMQEKKEDSLSWYGTCYFFLGYLEFCKQRYERALQYFNLSVEDNFRINDKYLRDPMTKYFFRALSLIKTGDYKQGKKILDGISLTTFSNLRWKNMILYEYAKSIGDWKSAYFFHKEYTRYLDSMNINALKGVVFDAEQKYTITEKQAEITQLENANLIKEKEQNKFATIIICFSLGLIAIIVILYGLYRRSQLNRLHDRQRRTAELYKMEADANEERLNQQYLQQHLLMEQKTMISADVDSEIIEGLNNLRTHIARNKDQSKEDQLKEILYNLEEDAGSLYTQAKDFLKRMNKPMPADERYNVVNLLRQLASRFQDEKLLRVTYDCEEQDMRRHFTNNTNLELYLVIKEAIANIIKHADATKVNVQISFAANNCKLNITDNGKGFDSSGIKMGIGLSSIEKRIKSLEGNFQINSGISGTSLDAEFPVAQL